MPEAILTGAAKGYYWDPVSIEAQFKEFHYPAPGHSKVHMLYRYGGSSFGTIVNSQRFVDMYQSPELECVVNQSVWNEGEVKFADIVLPLAPSLSGGISASGPALAGSACTGKTSSIIGSSRSSTNASSP